MKASARSAASYEDTPGRSIVALQKLSLQHDQELRELAEALTDLWLAPKSLKAVKAGLEAGADYMEEVKKRGRGHGLGAPYTHVAAAFVEALTAEAEGQPKQVLTTFRAHVAARQETVTGCFGAFRVKEASSTEETPAAQRKAKVTMTFNSLGVINNEGGRGRGNVGRRARGQARETSTRPNTERERSREVSGSRSKDRIGENSGETVARPAVCSAEVIERLRIMARSSVDADVGQCRKEQTVVPRRCCAVAAAGTETPAREASCCRALPRRSGQPRPC